MKKPYRLLSALVGVLLPVTWMLAGSRPLAAQASDHRAWLDPIARLARQIERGEAHLEFRPGSGYLTSLLERLDVGVDSQVLVFSKTSFQQAFISPQNPRAIYFNDAVAVGTVPGGDVLELTALDPVRGVAFYTLSAGKAEKPKFERRGVECMFCHGPGNHGAPALVVASVFPDAEGLPAFTTNLFRGTDHRTPFNERWGGWYVTGTHGSQRHLGNAIAPDPLRPVDLQEADNQNLTTLAHKFDTTRYLTPFSDIVALMVLEHQSGMTNLINSVSARYRRAELQGFVGDAAWKTLDPAIEELVTYMVFADEARLEEPVQGTSTFTTMFPQRGPRDARGRSLRDFDLRTRVFRYPLSYMIYSEIFDRMPSRVKERVYQRLYDVLTGHDSSGPFAAISSDARRAALDIVRNTKANLPPFFWDDRPETAK
ncbi:MAG TPA: hypothetical protein VH702_15510 [Vicinamibacterales bacterium]|jgi:hypothetical protein